MKRAALALLLIAAPASAEPARHTLGWDYGFGSYPIDDAQQDFGGFFGVHGGGFGPGNLRVDGEYDWVLTGDGHGHRLAVLAHQPVWSHPTRKMMLAVEVELGAGAALLNTESLGRFVLADVFAGARFSTDGPADGPSPSTHWGSYAALRALATHDGVGVIFSMGLTWGS